MNNIRFKNILINNFSKLIDEDYVLYGVPNHLNLGDTLIWDAEIQILDHINHKRKKTYFFGEPMNDIDDKTLILVHGGGYFGDVWKTSFNVLLALLNVHSKNRIIFLPNSMWFNELNNIKLMQSVLSNHEGKITICHRELQSYRIGIETFPMVEHSLLPDTVLGYTINKYEGGKGTLYINRKDLEKSTTNNSKPTLNISKESDWPTLVNTPSYIKKKYTCEEWERLVKDKLVKEAIDFIAPYETVYSDRMHGAILAWLLGKKTFLIDNSYKKSSSLYNTWIQKEKNITLMGI